MNLARLLKRLLFILLTFFGWGEHSIQVNWRKHPTHHGFLLAVA
jgi:hypothetical protein